MKRNDLEARIEEPGFMQRLRQKKGIAYAMMLPVAAFLNQGMFDVVGKHLKDKAMDHVLDQVSSLDFPQAAYYHPDDIYSMVEPLIPPMATQIQKDSFKQSLAHYDLFGILGGLDGIFENPEIAEKFLNDNGSLTWKFYQAFYHDAEEDLALFDDYRYSERTDRLDALRELLNSINVLEDYMSGFSRDHVEGLEQPWYIMNNFFAAAPFDIITHYRNIHESPLKDTLIGSCYDDVIVGNRFVEDIASGGIVGVEREDFLTQWDNFDSFLHMFRELVESRVAQDEQRSGAETAKKEAQQQILLARVREYMDGLFKDTDILDTSGNGYCPIAEAVFNGLPSVNLVTSPRGFASIDLINLYVQSNDPESGLVMRDDVKQQFYGLIQSVRKENIDRMNRSIINRLLGITYVGGYYNNHLKDGKFDFSESGYDLAALITRTVSSRERVEPVGFVLGKTITDDNADDLFSSYENADMLKSRFKGKRVLLVDDVIIAPQYQRQAYASMIESYLADIAYKNGYDGVVAEIVCEPEANTASISALQRAVKNVNDGLMFDAVGRTSLLDRDYEGAGKYKLELYYCSFGEKVAAASEKRAA